MGRKCRKVSCRLCKAPTHIPLSCDGKQNLQNCVLFSNTYTSYCLTTVFALLTEYQKEQEKNSVLSVQHKLEEHMSEALIRECPKCKSRFFKTEGRAESFSFEGGDFRPTGGDFVVSLLTRAPIPKISRMQQDDLPTVCYKDVLHLQGPNQGLFTL